MLIAKSIGEGVCTQQSQLYKICQETGEEKGGKQEREREPWMRGELGERSTVFNNESVIKTFSYPYLYKRLT